MDSTDDRVASGVLNLSDASRFLGLPRQTFQRWARGYERGERLLHVLPDAPDGEASVTFLALAEAHVLQGLRDAGVRTRRIRPALARLEAEFGRDYVLVAPELATDGIDVLWDFSRTREGSGLIEGNSGQRVMREIVEDYLRYLGRDEAGDPRVLELRHCQPSKVLVDPRRSFGQPVFAGTRVRLGDVAAMLRADEAPEVVADEFGIGIDDVRTAARVLLARQNQRDRLGCAQL